MPALHPSRNFTIVNSARRPSPALRLRLLRDLTNATGEAYRRWPEPVPDWLESVCVTVEAELEAAERRAREAGR